MTTGFVERTKGKIKVHSLYLGTGGIVDSVSGVAQRATWTNAGAPTNGTSGTLAAKAAPGDLLIDTTNKTFYQNTNTLASPTWTALTTATGAGTYTGTFDGIVGGTTPAAGTFTTILASGEVSVSAQDTVTAHAGGGRSSATAISKQVTRISVCATSADSVVLPAAAAGDWRVLANDGAAAAQVFANGSDTIDGTAGATGVVLTNTKRAIFFAVAANKWVSLMGVPSA